MIFSVGPKSPSLEAAYPFSSRDGSIRYHASPNGFLVMTTLNIVKRGFPISVLPLMAVILNAHDLPSPNDKYSTTTWAFNALCNTSIMHHASECITSNKANRFEKLAAWDEPKQRALLQAFRTVNPTGPMTELLLRASPKDLFRVDGESCSFEAAQRVATSWEPEYKKYLQIASIYGLDKEAFEFYLTIPSVRTGKRIFYPFFVLSRSQACAIGWDWYHLSRLATGMLTRMKRLCNRHAEEQDLGEKGLNDKKFICWMVAFFCRQVQSIELSMLATTTREEILFMVADRWGLPIVPWVGHPLSASLCKGPDHGIAMKLGIKEHFSGLFDLFDPLQHLDLNECTVTIDTMSTNMAMFNYEKESWPGIRDLLAAVPLSHPLWKIDERAGSSIWGVPQSQLQPLFQPKMPTAAFDMPLLSIEPWLSSAAVVDLKCDKCGASFNTLGHLVQHYRTTHNSDGAVSEEMVAVTPEQDAADVEYWTKLLTCSWPNCGKTFGYIQSLREHMERHRNERLYKCDWDGCGFATNDPSYLVKHKRLHVPDAKYSCTICDWSGTNKPHLDAHMASHIGLKRFACEFEGCDKKYARMEALINHRKKHLGIKFVCEFPGCEMEYTQRENRVRHYKRAHGGMKPPTASE